MGTALHEGQYFPGPPDPPWTGGALLPPCSRGGLRVGPIPCPVSRCGERELRPARTCGDFGPGAALTDPLAPISLHPHTSSICVICVIWLICGSDNSPALHEGQYFPGPPDPPWTGGALLPPCSRGGLRVGPIPCPVSRCGERALRPARTCGDFGPGASGLTSLIRPGRFLKPARSSPIPGYHSLAIMPVRYWLLTFTGILDYNLAPG